MGVVLQDVLRKHGPMLSNELAERLVAHGLTAQTARQRIARRTDDVRSIEGLNFTRNVRFIYLAKQYGSPRFWAALIKSLTEDHGAYARALAALRARGGLMPLRHFTIASGSPVEMLRRVAANEVCDRLVGAGLLQHIEVAGVGSCLALSEHLSYLEIPAENMRGRLITEQVLLCAVKTWAQRLALGSFNKFEMRDSSALQPRFGTFEFDLTAPSYVGGLTSWSSGSVLKPGFLVCDILLNGELSLEGMQPFVHKYESLRSLGKLSRCLPLFVADRYAPEALQLARTKGIVPATPDALFGKEVAQALKALTATLTSAANAALDPAKFCQLFDALSHIEGAVGTLRGALFEFVANELARTALHARTTMNRKLREEGRDVAEIDVTAVVEHQRVHFIECKGMSPGTTVEDAEVKRWLEVRIPAIRRWALSQDELKALPMVFELWTTGNFTKLSTAALGKAKETVRPSKYKIVVRGPRDIRQLTEKSGNKDLLKLLMQHFLASPLAGVFATKAPSRARRARIPMHGNNRDVGS